MSEETELLNYFKYAYYEGDQESFLMWLFNTKDQNLYQLRNDIIKCLLPGKFKDIINFDKATINAKRQYKEIDIVIEINYVQKTYLLGIEHKVHGTLTNKIEEYFKTISESNSHGIIMFTILAPFGLNEEDKKKYKKINIDKDHLQLVQSEYVQILNSYCSRSNCHSFVKDYYHNYFESIIRPYCPGTISLLQKLDSIVKYQFHKCSFSKSKFCVEISKQLFPFSFNFTNGDYKVYIDKNDIRNNLEKSGVIIIESKKTKWFKLYEDNKIVDQIKTLDELQKLFEIIEKSLS